MNLIGEFEIAGVPDLPNVSRYAHWTKGRKNVFRWKRLVSDKCYLAKIANLNLEKASLTFTRHSSREPDFDNLVASFKACQDGLVLAKVIIDDKSSVIGQSKYFWEYRPRKLGGKISIRVEA